MTAQRIQYTADGVQVEFPFPFRLFEETEVAVWVDTAPVDPADVTVALDPEGIGGTVSFDTAPADGAAVTLVGEVVPKRIATYQQSGAFRAQVINAELDRIVAVLAQLTDGQSRRLALPEIDPVSFAALPSVADRADRYLSFDAAGQPVARDIVGGVPIGVFGIALVDSADAAAARTLLELDPGAPAQATLGLGDAALEDVAAGGGGDLLREDGDGSGLTGIASGLPPGHLTGLTLANNAADPANDLDIAAGSARDAANSADLALASEITKRLDAAWSAGDDAGGLDTGTVAADTWYAVHLIGKADGTVDALFSTSATAPTMPAGYTLSRRIGWRLTDGAAEFLPCVQDGNRCWWPIPPHDVGTTSLGTSRELFTLSIPPSVEADLTLAGYKSGNRPVISVDNPDLIEPGSEVNTLRGMDISVTVFARIRCGVSAASQIFAMYYHRDDIVPAWAVGRRPIRTIGRHVFYRLGRVGR